MALTTPFHRRKPRSHFPDPSAESSARNKKVPRTHAPAQVTTYAASLGRWAAQWNHSSLTDITLAHVLSGDTVSPISLSDFEAFLTFCDISVENLQFIVWYQDYRVRFEALPVEQRAQIQLPCAKEEIGAASRRQSHAGFDEARNESKSSTHRSIEDTTSRSKDYRDAMQRLADTSHIASPLWINVPKTVERPKPSHFPTSLTSVNEDQVLPDDQFPMYTMMTPARPSFGSPQKPTTEFSSTTIPSLAGGDDRADIYPPVSSDYRPHLESQPFYDEIQNVLATFLVPGSKKELLLSSETRDSCVREARETVHPQAFAAAYEQAYQLVELVSLPRFLANAATNINRPRQLFWYSASVPTFLLGVAIALYFIISPSTRSIIPPQSHRAWRLLSLPLFFLASLCWYKGFRGFCPLLFLRSSRQLRAWELERLSDDSEAQAFVIQLTERRSSSPSPANNGGSGHAAEATNSSSVPATPISPTESEKTKARIAPFLEQDGKSASEFDIFPYPIPEMSSHPYSSSPHTTSHTAFPPFSPVDSTSSSSPTSSFSGRGSFHRPPVFGPSKVVEDARIRRVHLHLFRSLMRFGLICTAIVGAVVVAVPSAHSG